MKIVLQLNGAEHVFREPKDDSIYVEAVDPDLACPSCKCAPLRANGGGPKSYPKRDSMAADAQCMDCGAEVGRRPEHSEGNT